MKPDIIARSTRARAIVAGALVLISSCGPSDEERAANRAAAIRVVEQFGGRLLHVSLLAPPDQVSDDIRDQYGPYVTTLLLGGWLSDPASAPGRETSSPWPARIQVHDAVAIGNTAYDITGDVVYVTSVDGDVALREPVSLRVVLGPDDVWRISEWRTQR